MTTFYSDMAIDAIQNTKKQFVDTFVKQDEFKNPLNAFVDAQTAYTKQVAKTAWSLADATATAAFSALRTLQGGK